MLYKIRAEGAGGGVDVTRNKHKLDGTNPENRGEVYKKKIIKLNDTL